MRLIYFLEIKCKYRYLNYIVCSSVLVGGHTRVLIVRYWKKKTVVYQFSVQSDWLIVGQEILAVLCFFPSSIASVYVARV